jgi:hypothetical protein
VSGLEVGERVESPFLLLGNGGTIFANYLRTIGASWPFKEGEGLVVTLDLVPPNWDGKFILVPPIEGGDRED